MASIGARLRAFTATPRGRAVAVAAAAGIVALLVLAKRGAAATVGPASALTGPDGAQVIPADAIGYAGGVMGPGGYAEPPPGLSYEQEQTIHDRITGINDQLQQLIKNTTKAPAKKKTAPDDPFWAFRDRNKKPALPLKPGYKWAWRKSRQGWRWVVVNQKGQIVALATAAAGRSGQRRVGEREAELQPIESPPTPRRPAPAPQTSTAQVVTRPPMTTPPSPTSPPVTMLPTATPPPAANPSPPRAPGGRTEGRPLIDKSPPRR